MTNTKTKFKCPQCKKNLSASIENSGELSNCAGCGGEIRIPYPGMRRLPYLGYALLIGFGVNIFNLLGTKSNMDVVPVFTLVGYAGIVGISIPRAQNMGMHTWKAVLLAFIIPLIPFGILYLLLNPEGYSKDITNKSRRTDS